MLSYVDYAITKEDIKALKKAESLVFDYKNGKSKITCMIDRDNRNKDVVIECDTIIQNYADRLERDLGDVYSCSYVMMFPQYEEHWQTIVQLIRPGDRLTLNWRANNNNQYMTSNGLYNDELHLIIRRGVGDKMKKLTFHIASVQCKNNLAKMIRHKSTMAYTLED